MSVAPHVHPSGCVAPEVRILTVPLVWIVEQLPLPSFVGIPFAPTTKSACVRLNTHCFFCVAESVVMDWQYVTVHGILFWVSHAVRADWHCVNASCAAKDIAGPLPTCAGTFRCVEDGHAGPAGVVGIVVESMRPTRPSVEGGVVGGVVGGM